MPATKAQQLAQLIHREGPAHLHMQQHFLLGQKFNGVTMDDDYVTLAKAIEAAKEDVQYHNPISGSSILYAGTLILNPDGTWELRDLREEEAK